MSNEPMERRRRRNRAGKEQDSVFAGVVGLFAAAVERLRGRGREVEFTEEWFLWDEEGDGGLAAAPVPRRPPDRSGSGSAAVIEPIAEPSSDIAER
jgi:hypothetical protein